tara:strand:- start:86 stop:397 length:312 start_codon:yes stop_codon:yes gene_type:complete
MPRIKVTKKQYANVVETTVAYIEVPEGRDPKDFMEDIDCDMLHAEPLQAAEDAAYIRYYNVDPEDGPVARSERPVFVGTEQCTRDYEWCDNVYDGDEEWEVVE